MKVLARCFDRALVRCGLTSVCDIALSKDVFISGDRLQGAPPGREPTTVQLAWDELEVHNCDGCSSSYGPRGTPPATRDRFSSSPYSTVRILGAATVQVGTACAAPCLLVDPIGGHAELEAVSVALRPAPSRVAAIIDPRRPVRYTQPPPPDLGAAPREWL